MCFSATASFTASAVLAGVGTVTMVKVRHTRAMAFGASTLLFAAQQTCEGLLWLGFGHQRFAYWISPVTYAFLFFAQVVWPMWVPLSIYLFERRERNKKLLRLFIGGGMLYAAYAFYSLLFYSPTAQVLHHHILYQLNFPVVFFRYFTTTLYFVATV